MDKKDLDIKKEKFAIDKNEEEVERIIEVKNRGKKYDLEKIRKWLKENKKKVTIIPGYGRFFVDEKAEEEYNKRMAGVKK